jgi:hypothetical protein
VIIFLDFNVKVLISAWTSWNSLKILQDYDLNPAKAFLSQKKEIIALASVSIEI